MLTLAVFVTLWLFIGSVIMLIRNECTPGGVTRGEFVAGMVAWPFWAILSGIECIRLLLVL